MTYLERERVAWSRPTLSLHYGCGSVPAWRYQNAAMKWVKPNIWARGHAQGGLGKVVACQANKEKV